MRYSQALKACQRDPVRRAGVTPDQRLEGRRVVLAGARHQAGVVGPGDHLRPLPGARPPMPLEAV
jgi:hypothetical protein